VKSLFNPIFKRLDHHPLFEIANLPDGDAASIATWVLNEGNSVLPQIDRVDLYETRGCGAIVSRADSEELIPV
jgi:6-pyruvoyltetrahydropterin/6-carboxytetrahydropterin synthase